MSAPVLAATAWPTNAELVLACVELGYLRADARTFDATYGRGVFWKRWRPDDLVTNDARTLPLALASHHEDFRATHWPSGEFEAVVFDPPYKLNGTPTQAVDDRYGVGQSATLRARHALILVGIIECARLTSRYLLVKCQDQVCNGRVQWQTRIFADAMEAEGLRLVDALLMLGGRAQPAGTRQVHARRNYSTLLVGERS